MARREWHALDYLQESIARTDGAENFHAGLYESARIDFKQMCQSSSIKKSRFMDGILEKHNLRSSMKDIDHNHQQYSRKYSQSQILAACTAGLYLLRNGMKITLRDLEFACLESRSTGSGEINCNGRGELSSDFTEMTGKDSSSVLVRPLKAHSSKQNILEKLFSNLGIQLHSSAHVFGLLPLTASKKVSNRSVEVVDTGVHILHERFRQRRTMYQRVVETILAWSHVNTGVTF